MPDIIHDVPIASDVDSVFDCVSTAEGLAVWWSKACRGEPGIGNVYNFDFGPGYQWKAVVEEYGPRHLFVIRMTESDPDWNGTVVSFEVDESGDGALLRFEHRGWPDDNAHYRSSSYCWAMYLRCMKNFLEKGTRLEYDKRFHGE